MGWAQYKIPGLWNGDKPPFIVLRHKGRSMVVVGGCKSLERAQVVFRKVAEKEFGMTLEEFFQSCADDFNGDHAGEADYVPYTGEGLLEDKKDAYDTISNHGFEIARHVKGDVYLADEQTRTL